MMIDFVELSIGRVYFKDLNRKILNYATNKSTVIGSSLNINLFFDLLERKLIKLSYFEFRKLSVKDGQKIREKLKEILKRHGILEEEPVYAPGPIKKSNFSQADISWLEKSKQDVLNTFMNKREKGMINNG